METTRLSLDQFKAKAETLNQTEELEKLSGGILGSCHNCNCAENGQGALCEWICSTYQSLGWL